MHADASIGVYAGRFSAMCRSHSSGGLVPGKMTESMNKGGKTGYVCERVADRGLEQRGRNE